MDDILKCIFCDKIAKNKLSFSQHNRTCPKNPDRNYKNGMLGKTAWNKGLTKENNEIVEKYSNTIRNEYKTGKRKILGCATWDYKTRSEKAKEQKFGGYRENAGRSKKFKVFDSYGKDVCLQSSYELSCYQILNKLNINWIRPKALKYDNKNYFADFYLPDYDIWLDPKNDYKAKCDEEKIKKVIQQNNIKLFILTKNMLTEDYIASLL